MKELSIILEKLGIGLSRVLRYSFGGFMLIVLAAVVNPADTGNILKQIPWQLTTLSVVVIGAGIYSAHRSIVIPAHHLGLCFLFYLWEKKKEIMESESTSPTRWLGGTIGVKPFWRMLSYSMLRQSDLFSDQKKEKLNVSHAESGLVVMFAEGFFFAMIYALVYPDKSQVNWCVLFFLSIMFLVASYPTAFVQHTKECLLFRKKAKEVKIKLKEFGIPLKSKNG